MSDNSEKKPNERVTRENVGEIKGRLERGEGGILVLRHDGPGVPAGGCMIYLYAKAVLDCFADGSWSITRPMSPEERASASSTDHKDDRTYLFRYPTGSEEYVPKKIGGMMFRIHAHSTSSMGFEFEGKSLAIYIPHGDGNREDAVHLSLLHAIDIVLDIRGSVSDSDFDDLWRYVRQDLKDGEEMRSSLIGL